MITLKPLFVVISMGIAGSLVGCSSPLVGKVFEESVIRPIPASVKIVEEEDNGGMDRLLWTHFSVSPSAFAAILKSDTWVEVPNPSPVYISSHVPSWWDPKKLGAGFRLYEREMNKSKGEYRTKHLWVNSAGTEAYSVMDEAFR